MKKKSKDHTGCVLFSHLIQLRLNKSRSFPSWEVFKIRFLFCYEEFKDRTECSARRKQHRSGFMRCNRCGWLQSRCLNCALDSPFLRASDVHAVNLRFTQTTRTAQKLNTQIYLLSNAPGEGRFEEPDTATKQSRQTPHRTKRPCFFEVSSPTSKNSMRKFRNHFFIGEQTLLCSIKTKWEKNLSIVLTKQLNLLAETAKFSRN